MIKTILDLIEDERKKEEKEIEKGKRNYLILLNDDALEDTKAKSTFGLFKFISCFSNNKIEPQIEEEESKSKSTIKLCQVIATNCSQDTQIKESKKYCAHDNAKSLSKNKKDGNNHNEDNFLKLIYNKLKIKEFLNFVLFLFLLKFNFFKYLTSFDFTSSSEIKKKKI